MRLAPIHITFMMACHCSPQPEQELGSDHWNSTAGRETRQWLLDEALIDSDNRSTSRGVAWIEVICQTPLPVQQWVKPEAAHTKRGEQADKSWWEKRMFEQ